MLPSDADSKCDFKRTEPSTSELALDTAVTLPGPSKIVAKRDCHFILFFSDRSPNSKEPFRPAAPCYDSVFFSVQKFCGLNPVADDLIAGKLYGYWCCAGT